MEFLNNDEIIGVDCGASKVLVQSCVFDSKKSLISPGLIHQEYFFSDHPDWNNNYHPVQIKNQIQENIENRIRLRNIEKKQGDVIVQTINNIINKFSNIEFGICFPGLKSKEGISVLVNGPRIPNILKRLNNVNSLYNDSDCCVIGEAMSTIGKMKNVKNGVYIGGGTGIADGIILDGKIIDLTVNSVLKKSWELILPTGESVESWLSPGGMIKNHNNKFQTNFKTLSDCSQSVDFEKTINIVLKAFTFLIEDRIKFFKNHKKQIEKIVIGQRLGNFLYNDKSGISELFKKYSDFDISFSKNRETAALGAAWKKQCSQ